MELRIVVCEPGQEPEPRTLITRGGPTGDVIGDALRELMGNFRLVGYPVDLVRFVFVQADQNGEPNRWGFRGPIVVMSHDPEHGGLTEQEAAMIVEDFAKLSEQYEHPAAVFYRPELGRRYAS